MIIKIWKFLWHLMGNIRLTIYLLLISVALFITGAVYARFNQAVVTGLNSTRIQDWIIKNIDVNISISWWMPALLIVLFLLGINTFVCSFDRIISVIKKKNEDTLLKFMYKIAPSIIHCLFLVIIIGHLITFTCGRWNKFPVAENSVIEYNDINLRVMSVGKEYYPGASPAGGKISQVIAAIKDGAGNSISLSSGRRQSYKGYDLFLEMEKNTATDEGKKLSSNTGAKEPRGTESPNSLQKQNPEKKNFILRIVYDPGLCVIITGFTLILIIMVWYYIVQAVRRFN